MKLLLVSLRRLLPGTVMAVLIGVLSASGFWLHWTPRFESIRWGLTEMGHVWLGWGAVVVTGGYLVHHLARTWGPLRQTQRILGVALTADLFVALITGVVLVSGSSGGPPSWVGPLHFGSTFILLVVFVWHSAVGWRRWLTGAWTNLRYGVQDSSTPVASQAPKHSAPQEARDQGAHEAQEEPDGSVDES